MWKQVFIPTVILCASTVVAVLGGNDGCPAIYPIELQLGKNTEIWRSAVDGGGDGTADPNNPPAAPIPLCAREEGVDTQPALPFNYIWTAEHRIGRESAVQTFILQCNASYTPTAERPKGVIRVQHQAGYLQVDEGVKVDCKQTDQAVFMQIEDFYTLNQQLGTGLRASYGPMDQTKNEQDIWYDGRLFHWPLEQDGMNLLTVWRYPKVETWWRTYPAEKMYSAQDKMPLEQLPTVKIDAFGAELKMPGEVPDGADKPTIVCRKKPKSEDLKCPDTIKTSKFKLVLKSPLRVRIDQWGNGTTVEIERPCNAPTQVTLDWFDEAVTLPKQDAEGKGWDENIKPVKTTKCTFEGFRMVGESTATITLGGAKLADTDLEKRISSANADHQLGPFEWWYREESDGIDKPL